MIGIYHKADLDGIASGAIIKRKYPDCKMIGWDYGEDIPEIPKDESVIFIDVTFPFEKILDLCFTNKITVIDHHIGFKKEVEIFESRGRLPFLYIYEAGIAACEIGWKYFFPDEELPEGVELLSKYDTWRENGTPVWDNTILPYQYGVRAVCNSLETFPSYDILESNWAADEEFKRNGWKILQFQKMQNEGLCRDFAFPMTFKGLRAICLNQARSSSVSFESVWDEEKYDLMIPFVYNGEFWKFSLYTTKGIDCSVLAKQMGGGGHTKANGFETKTFEEAFL